MKKALLILIPVLICILVLSVYLRGSDNRGESLPEQTVGGTPPVQTLECDHAFSDWMTSKEATCSEEGQAYRACSKCEKEETKKLAKTDEHDFSCQDISAAFLASEATCASPAAYYYSCTCGKKGTDVFEYGEKSSKHLYDGENNCTVCLCYKDTDVVFTLHSQTNTYHVTDYTGSSAEIVIPSVYKGLPVSSIGTSAFADCKTITVVKLPSSIVSIDDTAFMNCTSLKSVILGESVQKIGDSAFARCSLLEAVELPSTLKEIGESAFEDCAALSEIIIPDSVVSVGEKAFTYCTSLKSVTLGKGIQKIEVSAFSGCSDLEAIDLPSNVTELGSTAFYGCTALTEIVIPDTVTLIGSLAFGNCENLRKVTLPFVGDKKAYPSNGTFGYVFDGGVKEVILTGGNDCGLAEQIPGNAFAYYSSLEKIVLSDTIAIIGDSAFRSTSLSSIQLPASLANIGREAFLDCNFTSFVIPDNVSILGENMLLGNPIESLTLPFIGQYSSQEFGELNHILGDYIGSSLKEVTVTVGNQHGDRITVPHFAFRHWSSIETVRLPNGITQIGEYAFYDCSSLQSINIPDSVSSIGSLAFAECTTLSSIRIPNGAISAYAFEGCTKLTEIALGSVSSIGEGAFKGCAALKTVTIPNSVTNIGISAFAECNKLEEMSIPFTGSQAGFNASVKYFGYIFAGNWGADPDPSVYQSDVPETLKTVYYTSGEDMLWHNAFASCYYIESIYISEGLEVIGNNAFKDSAIEYISLPESLTTIGTSAFEDCILLEAIVLGDRLTAINDHAFENTSALKNVYFRGTEEAWYALMENVREESLHSATKHYNYVV